MLMLKSEVLTIIFITSRKAQCAILKVIIAIYIYKARTEKFKIEGKNSTDFGRQLIDSFNCGLDIPVMDCMANINPFLDEIKVNLI